MFNLGKLLPFVTRALVLLPGAVQTAEQLGSALHGTSGAEKKAAVLRTVQAELAAAEGIAGKDFAHDDDVVAAAGAVIDATVALHTVVARKVGAPAAGV